MPPPSFLERTEGLVATFKFAELIGSVTAPRKKELTQRQREILRLLSKKPSSSAGILSHLEGTPSRRVVQLDLTYLERTGLTHLACYRKKKSSEIE